ncbi:RICIN domain-containing protein [Kitasatospora acidiphila]|uniref:RICIN domain-containing protein n=1 Tax=Kitasatospora acidiphila TaxID=2567942 RepID=A0A540WCA4_9ACTN|nr:RICIN domain-containing protein [Kitasatospora acidiphila]TQF06679.1 RICIN domain-containing protein [Kitasatospora acidiphila]
MRVSRRIGGLAGALCAVLLAGTQAATAATPSTAVAPVPAKSGGNAAAVPAKVRVDRLGPIAGKVPQRGSRAAAPQTANAGAPLTFQGGAQGVSTNPKVYLVFWGSQWNSDTHNVPDYLTRMFQGLGTANDTWSAVMTQYCNGVASGSTSCPDNAAHISESGPVYAGIWMDNGSAAPANASGGDLANEAGRAAAYFGNTDAGSNANAQYVVVSPSGTHPGGFPNSGGFCAWHSDANTQYGNIAYTNLPYQPDGNCGTGAVNGANGYLDGFGIVEGHEYAETVTDFVVGSGWTATDGEIGDKCAWQGLGNLSLPSGTFAAQPLWSNRAGGCKLGEPVPGPGLPTSNVLLTNPATGWVADMDNANPADGTRVKAYTPNPGYPQAQHWNLIQQPDGSYWFQPLLSSTSSLDANTNRSTVVDGTSYFAQLWTYGNSPEQHWRVTPNGDGTYRIIANDNGCLTANALGSVLGEWACTGDSHQNWTLTQ